MNELSPTLPWVIDATQAQSLLATQTTLLDVRNPLQGLFGHVPGAVPVNWRQFCEPYHPYKGRLLADTTALTAQVQALGVSAHQPVLVVGDSRHWGENGRVVWTLRTLGHPRVALVDGGYKALMQAGVGRKWGLEYSQRGDFTVQPVQTWDIQREELLECLNSPDWVILDTRSYCEYLGATPYGERRGGHLPGAKHCHFQQFLNQEGYLLPENQLWEILTNLGIHRDSCVAAYCTGGVRSAFVVAVLVSLGIQTAKNYAGSTWEWSAEPAELYPLGLKVSSLEDGLKG